MESRVVLMGHALIDVTSGGDVLINLISVVEWLTCIVLHVLHWCWIDSAAIYAKNLILIKEMSMTGYFDKCCEMIVWHPSGHNYSD